MLDPSFVFAPHLFQVMAAERERVAESRKWLRYLRETRQRECAQAAKGQSVIVSKPAHLAGIHKL
jgi:hypothetical protein